MHPIGISSCSIGQIQKQPECLNEIYRVDYKRKRYLNSKEIEMQHAPVNILDCKSDTISFIFFLGMNQGALDRLL